MRFLPLLFFLILQLEYECDGGCISDDSGGLLKGIQKLLGSKKKVRGHNGKCKITSAEKCKECEAFLMARKKETDMTLNNRPKSIRINEVAGQYTESDTDSDSGHSDDHSTTMKQRSSVEPRPYFELGSTSKPKETSFNKIRQYVCKSLVQCATCLSTEFEKSEETNTEETKSLASQSSQSSRSIQSSQSALIGPNH
uniref:SSP10 n=1 Tax=Albugo laibachii Nc14 TaxID=890382 RepID=F0WFH8_9STRA|nr:SSP10 [Albugo laibachii Nc14]|eukprot:CCA19960.1 SSP10 [Albugo laibachii Nc14]